MGNLDNAALDGRNRLRLRIRKVNKRIRNAISTSFLALGLGVLAAPAIAADDDTVATTMSTSTDRNSRENAKAANEAAVNEAVNAVIEATRLDLDIRLIGRTSVTVAAGD
jgi:hypothetical protein